jgi:hypothetical protein
MVNEDGSVTSIYCHFDGYPSNNGNILLKHYKTAKKVRELISLGDISSLRENVSPDPKGGTFRDLKNVNGEYIWVETPANGRHDFDRHQKGVVVAYHRDRKEPWNYCAPRTDKSSAEFFKSDVEEWGYLFDKGKWFVVDGHKERRRAVALNKAYISRHD